MSIGVAVSVGLAMLRVLTGISIQWFVIPGYLIALVLSRFVPDIFIGIAFDSGGVASGPMTSTFLLPLSIGVCEALGGNLMTDAFGVVALVALTPLIAIQLMGLVYKLKTEKRTSTGTAEIADDCDAIVDLEEGEYMDYEKKVSFQLLTLITTPKLAEKAAEMFKRVHCRCNIASMPKAPPPARSWTCSVSAASIKAF